MIKYTSDDSEVGLIKQNKKITLNIRYRIKNQEILSIFVFLVIMPFAINKILISFGFILLCTLFISTHAGLAYDLAYPDRVFVSILSSNSRIRKEMEATQPINVLQTIRQIFHTQIERPKLSIYMEGQTLDIVTIFKYLGFTWTIKMSLKPAIDQCLEKGGKALVELKWMKRGRRISVPVLKKGFFAYVFPQFAWVFPFHPFLPKTQREALDKNFRVAIRTVHRCPFVSAKDLFMMTQEELLEVYIQRYIKKRLENIYKSDLE